eukprot:GHVP01000189.1.p1 GENE.GHVP01000189.1~~GHVP01000189.1.p1  ORF type:complete len:214 (+),score=42.74 GHVP01000189.1:749-1390(+)
MCDMNGFTKNFGRFTERMSQSFGGECTDYPEEIKTDMERIDGLKKIVVRLLDSYKNYVESISVVSKKDMSLIGILGTELKAVCYLGDEEERKEVIKIADVQIEYNKSQEIFVSSLIRGIGAKLKIMKDMLKRYDDGVGILNKRRLDYDVAKKSDNSSKGPAESRYNQELDNIKRLICDIRQKEKTLLLEWKEFARFQYENTERCLESSKKVID